MQEKLVDSRPLVLVVDDDPSVREVVGFALEPRGCRVVEAVNGRHALTVVQVELPRLIVLDCWMPVLDGIGFLRELAAARLPRPPVILFTATDEDRRPFRDLGVDVCVQKPADMVRFTKLVEVMLRSSSPVPTSERRRAERRSLRRHATLAVAGGPAAAGYAVDISLTGIGVRVAEPPRPGANVHVTVPVTGGDSVSFDGRVRRVGHGGLVGVEFLAVDTGVRDGMQRLVG